MCACECMVREPSSSQELQQEAATKMATRNGVPPIGSCTWETENRTERGNGIGLEKKPVGLTVDRE